MTYDPVTLQQKAVFNDTPDGQRGGIWASDTGPAADANGNVYVPTGNGTFDASAGGRDYSDSVLKMELEASGLSIRDYFAPHDQAQLNDNDADVGSSGPLLLPDQPGPHPHLLLQPSKGGDIFVIDRDRMGKFQPDRDVIVQRLHMEGGGYGAMAYWNHHVFFACEHDPLRDYVVGKSGLTPRASSNTRFENPGATPTISANGTRDAIVWAIATKTWNGEDRPAILYAFDAARMNRPLYTSEQNSQRDRAAMATRFVIPVVVNGHVYFGAVGEVEMYGLLK
jgi:hypothetical protein